MGPSRDAEASTPAVGERGGEVSGSLTRNAAANAKGRTSVFQPTRKTGSTDNVRAVGCVTHLALKRVVPMLKTRAASASVSSATDASVRLFITCRNAGAAGNRDVRWLQESAVNPARHGTKPWSAEQL